jgi:CRISPR-associated endonuclease Cas1
MSELLGLEGNAARVYFRAWAPLVKGDSEEFDFASRNRRPPRDPVNALLSFCYALLTTTWTETAARVGFDPYLGFFHQPRYGRAALALDLMEEFRPLIADSVVLSIVRRGIVGPDDFIRTPTACALSQAGRRKTIAAYERRLEEEITHPVFGYRASYRRILEVQARLLGRHLTGELDSYPEFTTR